MLTDKEIAEALNTIKAVCTEHYDGNVSCRDCPLGDARGGECMVTKTGPLSWVVGSPGKWKALL